MKEVLDMYDWKIGVMECEISCESSDDFSEVLKGEIIVYKALKKQNALMAKYGLISMNEFNENEVRLDKSIKQAMWVLKTFRK